MPPKAKGELRRGQRPISSFFFKKPTDKAAPGVPTRASAPAAPSSKLHQPPSRTSQDDGSPGMQEQPASGPPHKRQRTEDSSLRDHHAHVAGTDAEPMDLTGDADGHDAPAAQPGLPDSARMQQKASAAAAERQQQAGPSGRRATGALAPEERHERWQSKLVHGTPTSRRGATAADIVPQNRTPLEEQVHALKRKHPGVLLVIEVCTSAHMFLPLATLCVCEH